jgi:large subunit ribosomal protein L23
MKFFDRWSRKKGTLPKAPTTAPVVEQPKVESEIKPEPTVAEVMDDVKAKKYHPSSHLLVKPLVTEKITYLQSDGKYGFEVRTEANKQEVKKAIEAIYGVHVVKVHMINCLGKDVRYGRMSGKRKDRKKAIVTLKKGERIEVHKNV